MNVPRAILLLSLVSIYGCEGSGHGASVSGSLLEDPLDEPPAMLSEIGLFPSLPDRTVLAPSAVAYAPTWPLWSNGSDKERVLVLPEGGVIDNSNAQGWVFPVGTLVFKTFSFPTADADVKPVETRLMRKAEDGWQYHVYQWDEAGHDAALIPIETSTPTAAIGPNGELFDHVIPGRLDCRKCHESSLTPIIGISELQLAEASSSEEAMIDRLFDEGLLLEPPSSPLPTIAHADSLTEEVLGYMQGNCTHCHHGEQGPATSFDLRQDVMLENTIGIPTEGSGTADGLRVVPGAPEESILFLGFSGETEDQEVEMMPPVGVELIDADAVELFRNWIVSLETTAMESPP